MRDVVKTTLFLIGLNDFGEVKKVYAEFFNKLFPARSTIQAAKLPKNALVEIEAITIKQ